METDNYFKLEDIHPEEFGDTLLKLEKSFGIKFALNSFNDAKTFGDICDIIGSQINRTDKNDCTTQQAFYKVRKAISLTQTFDVNNIKPQTKLENIFPRSIRRQDLKRFEKELGFSVGILTMKTWLALTIYIGFVVSIIGFFFSWQFALLGFSFFTLLTWLASKFSKELMISTVGELIEKVSRENYLLARRHSDTVNRKEIVKTIQDVFIADYEIAREQLTNDATLRLT